MINAGLERTWGSRRAIAIALGILIAITLQLALISGTARAACPPAGCGPPDPNDTTPPTVTSVSPAENATGVSSGTNVTVTFSETMDSATINTSTFTLVRQGTTTPVAANVSYNTTNDVATLDPSVILDSFATYTATVKGGISGVTDLAGNPLASDKTWTFRVADSTPPTVTLTSPANGTKVSTSISATANASDNVNVARVEFLVDGVSRAQDLTAPYEATINTADFTHGSSHAVSARAVDVNGNQTTGLPVSVTADRQVSASFVAPTPGQDSFTSQASPQVAFTRDTDVPAGSVLCRTNAGTVSGGTFAPCSSPYTPLTPSDGPYTVDVQVTDDVGNTATISRHFTVDRTGPNVVINSGPDGQAFGPGQTQTWTFSADDVTSGLASVQCSVVTTGSPASFEACSGGGSHAVTGKPEGNYTFTVRARDNGGLETTASRTFSIDATAPQTTITSGVADGGRTNQTTLTWNFSSSEAGSTFECRVYPAALTPPAFSNCSGAGSHTASGFSPGTYSFEVRATDASGNSDGTSAKRTFTIDTTKPTVGSVTPRHLAKNISARTNVTAAFSEVMSAATLNRTTFKLVKKGTRAPVAAGISYSGNKATLNPSRNLTAGATYTATVTTGAKDVAGNPLAATKTWRFTIRR